MTIVRLIGPVLALPASVVGISAYKIWPQLGQDPVEGSSKSWHRGRSLSCLAWAADRGSKGHDSRTISRELNDFMGSSARPARGLWGR